MDISGKKHIPLNLEKCEFFTPKKEKNIEKVKLNIDSNVVEENEQILKLEEVSRRKVSTDSTTISKIDDVSELSNFPLDNINIPQESSQENGIFFGKDKNYSNPIYNFYQSTEEYFQEIHVEKQIYKNSKNFPLKKENYKNNENKEPIKETPDNSKPNLNHNNTNSIQSSPSSVLMGTYINKMPNIVNDGKGKFDMPIYYVGFYGWDSKCHYY